MRADSAEAKADGLRRELAAAQAAGAAAAEVAKELGNAHARSAALQARCEQQAAELEAAAACAREAHATAAREAAAARAGAERLQQQGLALERAAHQLAAAGEARCEPGRPFLPAACLLTRSDVLLRHPHATARLGMLW